MTEQNRYLQQIKLSSIGLAGQKKLANARVLCIGAGGLAAPLLLYLTGAGIGKIGIIDDDFVELDNLHRQILFQQQQVGHKKVTSAKQQLTALNNEIDIQIYQEKFSLSNGQHILNEYDVIADCSDNFYTRYIVNDLCYFFNKPYVYAAVSEFTGQCAFFLGKKSACLRCLFPQPPSINLIPDCHSAGILGVLPGLLGMLQATEILKWILEIGNVLSERLLKVDALRMQFREYYFSQNPECELCVKKIPLESFSRSNYCINDDSISLNEFYLRLKNENVIIVDVRTEAEHREKNMGGILIPLASLSTRLLELDPDKEIILYCKSGPRSMQALNLLRAANFKNVKYLKNGINHQANN